MKKLLLSVAAIFATVVAHAATCDAGSWLNGTTCTKCNNPYYCPGDDMRYECSPLRSSSPDVPVYYSEPGATECKPCPLYTGDRTYFSYTNNSQEILSNPLRVCRTQWHGVSEHGEFVFSCFYSPNGDYIKSTADEISKCMIQISSCDAGYAAIDNGWSSSALSNNYLRIWVPTYDMAVADQCQPAPIGYYATADDLLPVACPDGTSTHEPGAASPAACVPLCANGGKKLHAGDHEFNIWPNGTCSHPSIGIGLPNGTCCVNLAPGPGTGINVEWDGKIYHTIN